MNPLPAALQEAPEAACILWNHWTDIRAGALVPSRSALDPSQLVTILPRMQILELQSPGNARCRLVGTGLRDLFGFDYTGDNFIELAPPPFQRTRSYRLWTMARHPCGSIFRGNLSFASGARALVGGLALPLLPVRAGGFRLLVSVFYGLDELDWINRQTNRAIAPAEHFQFLDIGAGLPEGTTPPEDWDGD